MGVLFAQTASELRAGGKTLLESGQCYCYIDGIRYRRIIDDKAFDDAWMATQEACRAIMGQVGPIELPEPVLLLLLPAVQQIDFGMRTVDQSLQSSDQ